MEAGPQWQAPPMERLNFLSWDEFFAYMEEYQQRTHQTFSRRSATSVKTRNQVLTSIANSGRPLPSPLLPERFLDYTRMLQCSYKLRGDARTHARWNGEEPSECQARVNATLQLGDDGNYRIRVTKASLLHNHSVDGATLLPAASASVPSGSSGYDSISQMQNQAPDIKRRRVGRPRKYPLPDEIAAKATNHAAKQDAEHVPTMEDVRAFLERVKRVRSNQREVLQSVEQRLAAYVNEFAALEGNAAKIFVDDEKVLSSITLQTKHMRRVFEAFPEYVQHAIVESDRSETLRAALDQFKAHNARYPRIRALIVPSEDSPELEELRTAFPTARVLYSQFHVVRALHKAIAHHGSDMTSWHRDRLTGIAQLMVYAPTSLVYGSNVAIMADVLGSKQHSFFRYFLEKWDSCRDRWTTFAREGVTTFSMSENDGQFVPTWKAIFAAANEEMTLDETVAAIRYYQTVVERAFIRDLNIEVDNSSYAAVRGHTNEEYDAEMRLLAATTSPAASSLVFPQYRYAISRGAYQFFEPTRGSFFVSAVAANDVFCDEPSKEFCVEADRGWQCSCAFMVNHHLPCRHIFYIRRIIRCGTIIPMESIEPRWVLAKAKYFFDSPHGADSNGEFDLDVRSGREHSSVIPPPGAWQKYVTAQEVGKRISQRMMEMTPEEFDRALQFYKLVESTLNVRPFNLSAAATARLNSKTVGFAAAPPHKPNWVEPDHTRSLAPRVVAGTVYMPASDPVAAAIATRKRAGDPVAATIAARQAHLAKHTPPMCQPTDIIDLQDESEEEEKTNKPEESERERASAATSSESTRKEEDALGIDASDNQNGEQEGSNEDETQTDESPNELSNGLEQAPGDSSPSRPHREPWEGIDGPGPENGLEKRASSPPHSPVFSD
ncbi:hypothetical protein PHMEG_0008828 [Phytophthora megakarya]|uniref:SWIM-type domain-containing protein n=1 Tax=Phytophthora megakarya TaxID=4795 RepID=A0A225WHR0_9STRA|nr:hypothetical protein PHMEG_0008828 [Phytophthora megakarya]